MKRNRKFFETKKLRKKCIEYLEEYRSKEGYDDKWVPGNPNNYIECKMIKAKIGSGNMLSKDARKKMHLIKN